MKVGTSCMGNIASKAIDQSNRLFSITQRKFIFKPGMRVQPRAPGFLKLLWFTRRYVCVCLSVCLSVCLPPRVLITSGMICCDIGCVQLVKQVSQLFPLLIIMTLAIDKMDGCGHINTACRERLPKKIKAMWY